MIIGGAIGCYTYFSTTPETVVEKAFKRLQANDLPEVKKILNHLETNYPSYPCDLYRGYLALHENAFDDAEFYFRNSLASHQMSLYGLATTLFLKGTSDKELSYLLQTTHTDAQEYELLLFEGLACYLKEEYEEASKLWSQWRELPLPFEQTWHTEMIRHFFSPEWIDLRLAHCFIEEGEIDLALQILEKEIFSDQKSNLKGLSYLLLGFASLKEAPCLALAERGNVYKLARFYFEKGTFSESDFREKEHLLAFMEKEAASLLQTEALCEWGFSLVHILEEWQAHPTLEAIAKTIAIHLSQNKAFATSLYDRFLLVKNDTIFKHLLIEALMKEQGVLIAKGDCKGMLTLWSHLEKLSDHPQEIAHQLCFMTAEALFRSIHSDGKRLEKSINYLNAWKQLEEDPLSRLHFAYSLIGHGEMLWKKEGEELKGTRLMEIALLLGNEEQKLLLLKPIEQFLNTLYREAESSNMIHRLSLIHDALSYFQLGTGALASPETLANHVADAEYLFTERHYAMAQMHTEWVLKFTPHDEEALRLYGLSSFQLGDYSRACIALRQLTNPDEQCRKALILSRAFSSQLQENHLAQRDDEDQTNDF